MFKSLQHIILTLFFLVISLSGTQAQVVLQSYADVGKNNVSDQHYVNHVVRSSFQYQDYSFGGGLQLNYMGSNPRTLSGLDITGTRTFSISAFPLNLKGYFILNRFSALMYETNWGAGLETRKATHFFFALGTNFKTYAINAAGRETYSVNGSESRLHENFGLTYTVTGYLKPHDHPWNAGLSLTNRDDYLINQATNPMINLQVSYKLQSVLKLYMEAWYKQAGVLNINANYFGYFIRGGLAWSL